MDLATVMLMLAVGSFIFALLLVILKFSGTTRREVPFWIQAKFCQAAGSLLLFTRVGIFDGVTLLANVVLLLGCAYEAWAVRTLSGRLVKRWVHLLVSVVVVAISVSTVFMAPPFGRGILFVFQTLFYFLPGVFLLHKQPDRSLLQTLLGVSYSLAGLVFLIAAIVSLAFPEHVFGPGIDRRVHAVIPLTSFCIFLISSYILLMLAKQRSDQQVVQIQKSLEKSEIQFQRMVETALEGILIFDADYRIVFANKQMASVLGYTLDELVGRPYSSFFPQNQLEIRKYQEYLRKCGKDAVYECCLLGKSGEERWFKVSAKAIMDEAGRFDGAFAMLTDITDRKVMELALADSNRRLTELSNTDSLTGIANRRCFDAALAREYARLSRTKSKLSIILIDVDDFKAYNDRYGHVMGDECLRQIGRVLTACIRESVDLAARYGGEEFACILPDTDLQMAVQVGERIQQRIRDLKIEHENSPVSEFITASFGVTTVQYSPERSLEEIIDIADKLLYQAKASGRNRIVFAELNGEESKKQIPS